MEIVKSPRSRFVHVMCKKCKTECVIYNKATRKVMCANKDCKETLAVPTGGEIVVSAKVLEILG